jgi:gluconate 2-dehydrogenase gamma chain
MARESDDHATRISRRELFKRAGVVGAAVAVPKARPAGPAHAEAAGEAFPAAQTQTPRREALETLTAAEADTLDAIASRLIPSDDNGPGAAEARAAHYIDRALGGALAASLEAYRGGLAAVDRYAQTAKGAPFARLSARDQDAVLTDMETNVATGFTPGAAAFFNLVRTHTIQGTFGDPYYGGNANFVGWDLIGYPGIRLGVAPAEQRLDPGLTPTHRSAYDHAMFTKKKPARASVERDGGVHGD